MSRGQEIRLQFDEESQHYYAIWEPPVAIGSGKTRHEALEDLRTVARFGIDTMIDLKLGGSLGSAIDG